MRGREKSKRRGEKGGEGEKEGGGGDKREEYLFNLKFIIHATTKNLKTGDICDKIDLYNCYS